VADMERYPNSCRRANPRSSANADQDTTPPRWRLPRWRA